MLSSPTFDQLVNEDFFKLLGLQSLSDDDKQEMLDRMNETVRARVFLQIIEHLSQEDREFFDQLPADDMLPFLQKHNINVEELIINEALNYRLEILAMYTMATQPVAA